MFLITLIGDGNTFIIWVSFFKSLDCDGVISSTKPLETDICLPKGQCIEGSGLNSCPSHSKCSLTDCFTLTSPVSTQEQDVKTAGETQQDAGW